MVDRFSDNNSAESSLSFVIFYAELPSVDVVVPKEIVRVMESDNPVRKIRLRGLIVLVPSMAILCTGFLLQPNQRGYGTHTQLGWEACGFKMQHGYPCPTCGLTTSVSAMTRGDIVLAWRSHPAGIVFSLILLLFVAAGVTELFGRQVLNRIGRVWWWVTGAGWVLLAGWGINVLRVMD